MKERQRGLVVASAFLLWLQCTSVLGLESEDFPGNPPDSATDMKVAAAANPANMAAARPNNQMKMNTYSVTNPMKDKYTDVIMQAQKVASAANAAAAKGPPAPGLGGAGAGGISNGPAQVNAYFPAGPGGEQPHNLAPAQVQAFQAKPFGGNMRGSSVTVSNIGTSPPPKQQLPQQQQPQQQQLRARNNVAASAAASAPAAVAPPPAAATTPPAPPAPAAVAPAPSAPAAAATTPLAPAAVAPAPSAPAAAATTPLAPAAVAPAPSTPAAAATTPPASAPAPSAVAPAPSAPAATAASPSAGSVAKAASEYVASTQVAGVKDSTIERIKEAGMKLLAAEGQGPASLQSGSQADAQPAAAAAPAAGAKQASTGYVPVATPHIALQAPSAPSAASAASPPPGQTQYGNPPASPSAAKEPVPANLNPSSPLFSNKELVKSQHPVNEDESRHSTAQLREGKQWSPLNLQPEDQVQHGLAAVNNHPPPAYSSANPHQAGNAMAEDVPGRYRQSTL